MNRFRTGLCIIICGIVWSVGQLALFADTLNLIPIAGLALGGIIIAYGNNLLQGEHW